MHRHPPVVVGLLLCCALGGLCCSESVDSTPNEPIGAVGSHIWFKSSVRVEIERRWAYDGMFLPDAAPRSGSECWSLDRSELSDAQIAALQAITLVALKEGCPVDGFDFHEVRVLDADGSKQIYRDTGCYYLAVQGATVMLSAYSLDKSAFPSSESTTCPQ